jgi:2-haloacid dehalogenase
VTQKLRSLKGVRACVFDAYGTLFDFASAAARCADVPEDRRAALTALWRDKQLQYTWLRTLENRYADFWQVTGEALYFALESLNLRTPSLHERLMELYLGLDPFAEVPAVLAAVREAGFRTAILSNGSPAMLDTLVKRSGLEAMFDAVLSADAVGAFKTHPRVYQYALDSLGLPASAIAFQSSNAWDARGVHVRHAGHLVQPLRPAPRTPSRLARLRDPDARRIAAAALSRRRLSRRYNGSDAPSLQAERRHGQHLHIRGPLPGSTQRNE